MKKWKMFDKLVNKSQLGPHCEAEFRLQTSKGAVFKSSLVTNLSLISHLSTLKSLQQTSVILINPMPEFLPYLNFSV